MSDHMVGTRPRIKLFTILAMCLGVMAIGASSASAATPTKYTFKGTSGPAVIYAGGSEGVIKCEKLAIAGQATGTGSYPNEVRTGTVTSITPTNCNFVFANVPVALSLNSPWTVTFNVGKNTSTVGNFNLHGAWASSSEVYFDMTGESRTFLGNGFGWRKENPLAVKSSNFAMAVGMANTGPGYLEASFGVVYTKVS